MPSSRSITGGGPRSTTRGGNGQGHNDYGPEHTAEWIGQVQEVEAALDRFAATGDVLELAGGTGWWTQRLARTARRLTVVDSSSEALLISRSRVNDADVEFVVADIFEWLPARRGQYDTVFFSFWLSHVPRMLFEPFWGMLRGPVKPGGRVFLVDNRFDPTWDRPDPCVMAGEGNVQVRRLDDGSTHRVVKVFYEPEELSSQLQALGWDARIGGTRWLIHGRASLRTAATS